MASTVKSQLLSLIEKEATGISDNVEITDGIEDSNVESMIESSTVVSKTPTH